MVYDIVMSHASLSLYLAFLLITFNSYAGILKKEKKALNLDLPDLDSNP